MDNYVNDETKEKMQDIAEKLFILLHGYSYFCDSIEGEIFQDNALELSSYAYLLTLQVSRKNTPKFWIFLMLRTRAYSSKPVLLLQTRLIQMQTL